MVNTYLHFLALIFLFFLDSVSNLCLKDLSKTVIAELVFRLLADPNALQRFYQSFGLDREKLRPYMLHDIAEFFPATPVKLLKDVFREFQLYDLAEMLEKVKSRALRLSLPLKEMKKNASERPSKVYSKVEVLMIEYSDWTAVEDAYPDVERIGCFFLALNSQNQITKLTVKVAGQTEELIALRESKETEDNLDLVAKAKEAFLKKHLEEEIPRSDYNVRTGAKRSAKKSSSDRRLTEEERSVFQEGGPAVKNLLEKMIEEREQRKLEIEKIVKEIQQKEEEVKRHHQREKEKFLLAVSTVMDKWNHQAKDEGLLNCYVYLLAQSLHVILRWWFVEGGYCESPS